MTESVQAFATRAGAWLSAIIISVWAAMVVTRTKPVSARPARSICAQKNTPTALVITMPITPT